MSNYVLFCFFFFGDTSIVGGGGICTWVSLLKTPRGERSQPVELQSSRHIYVYNCLMLVQ